MGPVPAISALHATLVPSMSKTMVLLLPPNASSKVRKNP
jgi:hypothetical protein